MKKLMLAIIVGSFGLTGCTQSEVSKAVEAEANAYIGKLQACDVSAIIEVSPALQKKIASLIPEVEQINDAVKEVCDFINPILKAFKVDSIKVNGSNATASLAIPKIDAKKLSIDIAATILVEVSKNIENNTLTPALIIEKLKELNMNDYITKEVEYIDIKLELVNGQWKVVEGYNILTALGNAF